MKSRPCYFRNICDDGTLRDGREQQQETRMANHDLDSRKLDRKIIQKRSIPAQIVFWVVIVVLLYAFYRAFA